MADATNALPLNTVVLWVTNTIERDYVARGVFPKIRLQLSKELRSNATLHCLMPAEAEAMLADATKRASAPAVEHRWLRKAYGAFINDLRAATVEADARPAAFATPAAVNIHRSDTCERWRGTKGQLQAIGIRLDAPWPGEAGGKRWGCARDARSYKTSITKWSTIWPGLACMWPRSACPSRCGARSKSPRGQTLQHHASLTFAWCTRRRLPTDHPRHHSGRSLGACFRFWGGFRRFCR